MSRTCVWLSSPNRRDQPVIGPIDAARLVARRQYRCTSCSQVNPMAPNIVSASSNRSGAGATAMTAAAGGGQPSLLRRFIDGAHRVPRCRRGQFAVDEQHRRFVLQRLEGADGLAELLPRAQVRGDRIHGPSQSSGGSACRQRDGNVPCCIVVDTVEHQALPRRHSHPDAGFRHPGSGRFRRALRPTPRCSRGRRRTTAFRRRPGAQRPGSRRRSTPRGRLPTTR